MRLLDVTMSFFARAGLVGSRGVVAISGGPDSVALAHLLSKLLRQGHISGLILAHVNHQLRGAESDEDEAFILNFGATLGCPVRVTRVDTATKAHGDNLEKVARDLRYSWLGEVGAAENASWVATAHTADDQAETVLHRILRGSGLQGLAGILPRRPLRASVELVRPLLTVRRHELLAYLDEHKLTFRRDSSNDDLRFTRNRIRRQLLPALAQDYQPAVVDVLARLAEQARTTQEHVRRRARRLLRKAELPRAGGMLVFKLNRLEHVAPFLLCEVFRLVWQREGWPRNNMTQRAWLRLVDLVRGRMSDHDFPGRVRARRRSAVLQIEQLTLP